MTAKVVHLKPRKTSRSLMPFGRRLRRMECALGYQPRFSSAGEVKAWEPCVRLSLRSARNPVVLS